MNEFDIVGFDCISVFIFSREDCIFSRELANSALDRIVSQRAILYNTHVLLMNSLDVNHVQKKKEVSSTPSDCRGGIKMGRERKKYCESCVQSHVSNVSTKGSSFSKISTLESVLETLRFQKDCVLIGYMSSTDGRPKRKEKNFCVFKCKRIGVVGRFLGLSARDSLISSPSCAYIGQHHDGGEHAHVTSWEFIHIFRVIFSIEMSLFFLYGYTCSHR